MYKEVCICYAHLLGKRDVSRFCLCYIELCWCICCLVIEILKVVIRVVIVAYLFEIYWLLTQLIPEYFNATKAFERMDVRVRKKEVSFTSLAGCLQMIGNP